MEMLKSFSPRMMYRSDKSRFGFTIPEVTGALVVLGLVCAMIFPIIQNAMQAYSLNSAKLEAFQVARENMENLIAAGTVTESVEYGISEMNPNIEWETAVEPFDLEGGMWVRAVCSATYFDANDQPQKVELVHWLSELPKDIAQKIMNDRMRDANEMGIDDYNDLDQFGRPRNPRDRDARDRDLRNRDTRAGDRSRTGTGSGSGSGSALDSATDAQIQQFLKDVQEGRK
jgi:type II secretory pathway pseudopilin PulG